MKYVLILLALALGIILSGCKTSSVTYQLETNVPNVWDSSPTQSVTIKAVITERK